MIVKGKRKKRMKTGRERKKEGPEGGSLDVGPDISESCNYTDRMIFYKVSEHPGNMR